MSQKTRPISLCKTVKCVLVGDGSVGKTCMLVSYTSDKFPTDYIPTIFENYSANVKVDHQNITLSLWDTAGQEDYSELRKLCYPQADVFLIVFSIADPSSLENALKKWLPELNKENPQAPKLIIGNKIDLRGRKAPAGKEYIEKESADKVVRAKGCQYLECSALSLEGLTGVFEEGVRSCLRGKDQPVSMENRGSCCSIF